MNSVFKKISALLLAVLMLFSVCACSKSSETEEKPDAPATSGTDTSKEPDAPATSGIEKPEGTLNVGEGDTSFEFHVVDGDGNDTAYIVNTDKTTVGDALQQAELIEGEMGVYGLYVKSVNGVVADYDVDGTYWAFYVDGEYALTGVDQTEIEDGVVYSFKVERS